MSEQHTDDIGRNLGDVYAGRISRRQALKTLGAAATALAVTPMLSRAAVAASESLMGPGGIPLARPDRPVTLPVHGAAIKSGLQPETGGTFTVFNYPDYLDKGLLQAFGKKHGVDVQISTFDSMDQGITRLASHAVEADVTDITPDRLAQAVAGKLLQPINHDYIPNLEKNVWPQLHSPFYD